MKSILISIKPKYVADILNGEKIVEIRKTMPKCELPINVYIYCTKDNKQRLYPVALLDKSNQIFKRAYREDKIDNRTNYLNGKVVAKFTLNYVGELKVIHDDIYDNMVIPDICITHKELEDYLKDNVGYAWHISNLVIFDKPKELSEFKVSKIINVTCNLTYLKAMHTVVRKPLTKAPQSWQFIEVD